MSYRYYRPPSKELRRIIHTCPRDEFVMSMYNVLNSGSRPFTSKMHISVKQIIRNSTPDKLKKKEEKIKKNPRPRPEIFI